MEHKELLEKVMQDRLERSLNATSDEEKDNAFEEAMKATDRCIEIEKIETGLQDQKVNRIVKIVEIAAVPVALAGLNYLFKKDFLKNVMRFEREDTFTGSGGRSISSWFRFKD